MTIIRGFLLLVVLVTWNASLASAQNIRCDASQFDALTNMWKLEPDQNTREVSAAELVAERKIMRRVEEMFKSTFVPTGDPQWHHCALRCSNCQSPRWCHHHHQ